MIIQDYRIIKQIRDQFYTSNYLLDSISNLNKISKTHIPEDCFIEDLPFTYAFEQELIKLNIKTFNSYQETVSKISELIKSSLGELKETENFEEICEKIENDQQKFLKKRRKFMSMDFNLSKKTNFEVCEEVINYFKFIVPIGLLEEKLNKELNLTSDFSILLADSKNSNDNIFEIKEMVEKSIQISKEKFCF